MIKYLIESEEQYILRIKAKLDDITIPSIDGRLHVYMKKGHKQYYHYIKGAKSSKPQRIYLNKDKLYIAERLVAKEYYLALRKFIDNRLRLFKSFKKTFSIESIDDVFYNLAIDKRAFVNPIVPTYEMILKSWKDKKYIGLGFTSDSPEIFTKKGERVRSKSEKILADTFNDMGIEYKYECPLVLDDGTIFYPDFTFLHFRTGREIYWEHLGMMDNINYQVRAFQKIDKYELNAISRFDRLIITTESSKYPLNQNVVEILIKKYLLT